MKKTKEIRQTRFLIGHNTLCTERPSKSKHLRKAHEKIVKKKTKSLAPRNAKALKCQEMAEKMSPPTTFRVFGAATPRNKLSAACTIVHENLQIYPKTKKTKPKFQMKIVREDKKKNTIKF